jgi:uncharacterized radical SAM superfamily Fe-S cluster-containing enzyme
MSHEGNDKIIDNLETWEQIRNMKAEDIYADIVIRFHAGEPVTKDDIKFMIGMINEKAKQ